MPLKFENTCKIYVIPKNDEDGNKMIDIEKNNQNLSKIIALPDDVRDEKWENNFFQALSQSHLEILTQEPQAGPDGWPYLFTGTGEGIGTEPFQNILQWLSEKGVGLVLNPQKEFPDYVFTYGMIWHFKETGLFFKEVIPLKEGLVEFQVKDIKFAGEPSAEYLPQYVRNVIKEFFIQQGVLTPKFLAFSLDGNNYELAFSKESLGNPPENEHQGILEALSWFLPPHYQVILVSENELPFFFTTF